MFNFAVLLWLGLAFMPEVAPDGWKQLAPGMDYQNITEKIPSTTG